MRFVMLKKAILTFFTFLIYLNVISQPSNSGIIAHYPFNNNANDVSGNNLNGSVIGATPTFDRFGNPNSAYNFDGTNDSIVIPHYPEFDYLFQNDFTLSVWIRPLNPSIILENIIFKTSDTTPSPGYSNYPLWLIRDGDFTQNDYWVAWHNIHPCNSWSPVYSDTMITSQWQNIVIKRKGQLNYLYFDGQLISQTFAPETCKQLINGILLIGGHSGGGQDRTFDGDIDDILIFDKALTDCEILGLYNLDSGLVGNFPFYGNADNMGTSNSNGNVIGPSLTTDRFGIPNSAYQFDGINDYISIPHDNALKPNFPFSISLWMKADVFGSNTEPVYTNDDGSNNYSGFWVTYSPSGKVNVAYGSGGGVGPSHRITKQSAFSINNTDWFHIAAVYNGLNDIDVYINNNLDAGTYSGSASNMVSFANNGAMGRTTAPLSGVNFYDGKLDDIKIYNRALSECEVKLLYGLYGYGTSTDTLVVCPYDSLTLVSQLDNPAWFFNGVLMVNPNGTGIGDTLITPGISEGIITIRGDGPCGCIETDSIIIKHKPTPNYTLADTVVLCADIADTIPFTLNSSASVNWSADSLFVNDTSIIPILNPISNNSTSLRYLKANLEITDLSSGCSLMDSIDIIVHPKPRYSLVSDTINICSDQSSGNVFTNNPPALGIVELHWQFNGNTGSVNPFFPGGNLQVIAENQLSNDTLSPIYLELKGIGDECSYYDTIPALLYGRFDIDAGKDSLICNNTPYQIGESYDSGYVYNWHSFTIPNLDSPSNSDPIFQYDNFFASIEDIIFILTKTDTITGCFEQDSILIQANKALSIGLESDTTICSDELLEINSTSNSAFNFIWSGSDSLVAVDSIAYYFYLNSDSVLISDTITLLGSELGTECPASDTMIVSVKPQIYFDAGSDLDFCGSDTLAFGTYNSKPYNYSWSPQQGIDDVFSDTSFLTLDNFTDTLQVFEYVLEAQFDGCNEFDSLIVQVRPKPFDQLSGPNVVCPGVDTADYFAHRPFTDYSYSWFIDGGNIGNDFNDSITVSWDSTNFNAYVGFYPENPFGCVGDTFIWNVRINPLLIPEIEFDTLKICERDKDKVTFNIKYPIVNSNYTWFVDNGTISSGQGSDEVEVDWNGQGMGQIWVSEENITNLDSCFGISDTISIEVLEDPILDSIFGPKDICDFGDTLLFTSNSTLSGSFIWSSDSVSQIVSGQGTDSIYITTTADGDFQIQSFITSLEGCNSDTLTDTVNVRYLQKPEIKIDTLKYCYDDSIRITMQVLDFYQGSNYQWTTSAGQIIGQGNGQIEIELNQADTFRVFVEEINTSIRDTCFTISDTIEIIAFPYPSTNSITGSFDYCDLQDSVWYVANGDTSSTYHWSFSGPSQLLNSGMGDSLLLEFINDGDIPISVYEESIFGCYGDTLYDTINVRYLQIPEILVDTNQICFWDSVDFSLSIADVYDSSEYQWSINSGQIISGQGENILNIRLYQPDTLLVFVNEINNAVEDSCYGVSDTIAVYFYPRPERELSITGADSICINPECQEYDYPGWPNSFYQWFTTANQCLPWNNKQVEVSFDTTGIYQLSVIETSEFMCVGDTVEKTIEIFPIPDTKISLNDSIICPTDQNQRIYRVEGFDFSEFTWQIEGGEIQFGNGMDSIIVNWTDAENLDLKVYETSFANCIGDTISFPLFTDNMDVEIYNIGYREDFSGLSLAANSELWEENPNSSIFFYSGGEFVESQPIEVINFLSIDSILGNEIRFYEVSVINACQDTLFSEVHNNVVLEGEADEESNTFSLNWNPYEAWLGNVEYEVYEYELDSNSLIETVPNEFLSFQNPNRDFKQCFYVLAREDEPGGFFSRSNLLCFEFKRSIFIPNVITPNNDGKNDKFFIENLDLYPDHELVIYNRSGRPLYESKNYDQSWPGDEISSGVYFFQLMLNNESDDIFKGFVQLMR